MIQKKVCMLGAFAVGKTSLVSRFVKSIFSEKYQATIGVTIEKKEVLAGGQAVNMILWDIAGEDELEKVRPAYLRGAAGYVLVVDGTRRGTLDTAVDLHAKAAELLGDVPFVVLLNKSDLTGQWALDDDVAGDPAADGWTVTRTSAKTGDGVEAAFGVLAERMLQ